MAFWALSDPHLSFGNARPMHVFGEHWRNHWEKIERAWRDRVSPADDVDKQRTLGRAAKGDAPER